ncbi:condensation domain-containing protein [Kitasatospora sp. NPDC091335]|uniref:condensation domain-containing protein n=1 Tax=Kitasatospora sp. NPDC091335 TaxID=3364085 RepID=UPI00380E32EB
MTTTTDATTGTTPTDEGWKRLLQLLDEREIVLRTTGERLSYLAPAGAMDEEVAGLVRAHRDRLLTILTGAGAAESAAPASVGQRRMSGTHARSADPAVWNVSYRVNVGGQLDPPRMAAALTALIERHESLRTRILDTELGVLQHVLPSTPVVLPVEDLSALPPAEREAAVAGAVEAELSRPFDLAAPPLVRTRLLRESADGWVLLLTIHHIAIDGWSMATVLTDLAELYRTGRPLPEEPARMTDYACWQLTVVNRAGIEAATDHWVEALGEDPLAMDLPTDRPRPERRSGRGDTLELRLPAVLADAIGQYAAARSTTASAVIVAACARLLCSIGGAPQALVLLSNANRTRPVDEGVVGLLTGGLPILVRTEDADGFGDLVDRAGRAIASALDHAVVPFGLLVPSLRERGVQLPPTYPEFQLAVQSTPPIALDLPGLTTELIDIPGTSARGDFVLALTPEADGYAGLVEYDTDLFDKSTVRSWLDTLATDLAGELGVPLP